MFHHLNYDLKEQKIHDHILCGAEEPDLIVPSTANQWAEKNQTIIRLKLIYPPFHFLT